MTPADLIAFEADIAREFDAGKIHGPVHLSGGNEQALIDIFRDVRPEDYVFSTWRSHYHALLKGIPPVEVKLQIMEGRSMFISSVAHRFYASAIMGGCLPIACGLAAAGNRVWCFVGDMCSMSGAFHDAWLYAMHYQLPATFVIEDNGFSTNSPTLKVWNCNELVTPYETFNLRYYKYERTYGHYQPYGHVKGF